MARKSRRRTRRRRTRKRRGGTSHSAMPNVTTNTQRALARKHRFGDLVKRRRKYNEALKESRSMPVEAKRAAFAKGSMGKASRNVLKLAKGGKRKSRRRRTRRRRRR